MPPGQLMASGPCLLGAQTQRLRPSCPHAQPGRGFAARASAGRKKAALSNGADADGLDQPDMSDQSTKALARQSVMNTLNKKYGERSVRTLSDDSVTHTEFLSTGALTLDLALGGGLPRGGIVEIFGPESTGKTSLALSAVAQAQRRNGHCAFIDLEHALSQDFAQSLGVRLDQLTHSQPSSGDEALDMAAQLAASGGYDIVVVDSVAALIPRNELEGEIGMSTMGAQARLMSSGLRILTPLAAKHGCCVIFINQIRMKVGVVFGNPETTPGGMALKFHASQRIDLRKKGAVPANKASEQTGITVKAKVVKNKVGAPGKVCEYDFMFESGINSQGCLLDVAEKLGLTAKKGSWYFIDDRQVAQGKEKCLEYLAQNADAAETLEQKVWQALKDKQNLAKVESLTDDIETEYYSDEALTASA